MYVAVDSELIVVLVALNKSQLERSGLASGALGTNFAPASRSDHLFSTVRFTVSTHSGATCPIVSSLGAVHGHGGDDSPRTSLGKKPSMGSVRSGESGRSEMDEEPKP